MYTFLCDSSKGVLLQRRLIVLFTVALVFGYPGVRLKAQTATPVNVVTWRYDLTHQGQNTQETLLTPANVTRGSFGKLFSLAVDGYVYAQPLYVSGLTMGDGQLHNVVFVATEHDSVYAFDADTNGGANANPLWQASLLTPAYGAAASGVSTVPSADLGTNDLIPEIGVTGTPAINLATQTMYLVSATKENGAYYQRLHAINIITGAEQPNSPMVIRASVPGTGNGSSGGMLPFSPLWQMNRGALDFYNGKVYIPFGSHGDNGPWHGWLFAYDGTTLTQTGVICTSPNAIGDGIWAAGAGLPIDQGPSFDRLFFVTGNGTYSGLPPITSASNFGDSVVTVSLANGGLTAVDAFTVFNQATLSAADQDQGSGGLLMPPDQTGPNPHILIQVGKEGRILVLNRDNLGGYIGPTATSNTNALQDIPNQVGGHWGTPAYWNGNVYFWGSSNAGKLFSLQAGVLATTYSSATAVKSAFPAPTFVITSNGTQNGIAWAVRTAAYTTNGSEVLYAFDATNLGNLLYESDTAPRDDAGPANKFVVPVITNGKVYVGASHQVDVYGLLGSEPVAGNPEVTPNGGSFVGSQQVSLSSTTSTASIYYTLDGSVPTVSSNLYTTPFTITFATTVRAIASAPGYLQSAVTTVFFQSSNQAPPVTVSPASGTYNTLQVVTLSDADPNATIYYTLDGSTPSTSSPKYAGPIRIASSTVINAFAVDPMLPEASNVTNAPFVISPNGSFINFGGGFASVSGLQLNGFANNSDDSRLQLTTGGTNEAASAFYIQPINIQAFTTNFTFQLSNAVADGFTFTIQNVGPKAMGAPGAALGYSSSITKSVAVKFDIHNNAGEGNNSTGVYTNGAMPTVPAVNLNPSGITLASGDSIAAQISYDGITLTLTLNDVIVDKTFTYSTPINIPQVVGGNTAYVGFTAGSGGAGASQKILTWTYAAQTAANTTAAPLFSEASGTYSSPQAITMASATPQAAIYYTTDGTTPTTASTLYSGPVTLGYGSTTLQAIAVAPGLAPSSTTSESFLIIQPVTPTPSLTPGGGSYGAGQTVAITDSDSSAVIYYTLDGTKPSTSSTVYSGPLTLNNSVVINALAIDPADAPSVVVSGTYLISSGNGSIGFPTGFMSSAGMKLNGSAKVTSNLLQLTSAVNQAGSAFWNTPVNIQAFSTSFNFQLVKAVADGFTFTIQGFGPTALGSTGSSLGYGSTSAKSGMTTSSVAVKFDFHNNAGEGNNSTGVYTDGATPTVPAITIPTSTVVLASGDVIQAALTYNGTTLTLSLTDTVTNKNFTPSFTVNVPQTVGGNTAYVGFTGGTGGSGATQDILNWTFTSTSQTSQAQTVAAMPQLQNVGAGRLRVGLATGPAGASSAPKTGNLEAPGYSVGPSGTQAVASRTGGNESAERVEEPRLIPLPGVVANETRVRLICDTPHAVIHYTVDGSQPTSTSPVFRDDVVVSGTSLTIKAFSKGPSGEESAVVTGNYHVARQ